MVSTRPRQRNCRDVERRPREKKRALRPRDAATLILLEGKGDKAKVLLGKRHHGHKFMPGKFVFPGGRVEAGDRLMNVAGALNSRVEGRLMKRRRGGVGPDFARALALAAIRETFEETGLVIGTADYGGPEGRRPARGATMRRPECLPDLQEMHFIARAITPPHAAETFRHPLFRAGRGQSPRGWRVSSMPTPNWSNDLDRAEGGRKLDLPPITIRVLAELRQRLDGGMSFFTPAPFFYQLHGKWRRDEL